MLSKLNTWIMSCWGSKNGAEDWGFLTTSAALLPYRAIWIWIMNMIWMICYWLTQLRNSSRPFGLKYAVAGSRNRGGSEGDGGGTRSSDEAPSASFPSCEILEVNADPESSDPFEACDDVSAAWSREACVIMHDQVTCAMVYSAPTIMNHVYCVILKVKAEGLTWAPPPLNTYRTTWPQAWHPWASHLWGDTKGCMMIGWNTSHFSGILLWGWWLIAFSESLSSHLASRNANWLNWSLASVLATLCGGSSSVSGRENRASKPDNNAIAPWCTVETSWNVTNNLCLEYPHHTSSTICLLSCACIHYSIFCLEPWCTLVPWSCPKNGISDGMIYEYDIWLCGYGFYIYDSWFTIQQKNLIGVQMCPSRVILPS